jgi:hypothetical protein
VAGIGAGVTACGTVAGVGSAGPSGTPTLPVALGNGRTTVGAGEVGGAGTGAGAGASIGCAGTGAGVGDGAGVRVGSSDPEVGIWLPEALADGGVG